MCVIEFRGAMSTARSAGGVLTVCLHKKVAYGPISLSTLCSNRMRLPQNVAANVVDSEEDCHATEDKVVQEYLPYFARECERWERKMFCYAMDKTRDDATAAQMLIERGYFAVRLMIETLRPFGSAKEILDRLEKLCLYVEGIPRLDKCLTAVGMAPDDPLRPSTVRQGLLKKSPEATSQTAAARNLERADLVEAAELSLLTISKLKISRDDRLIIQWIRENPASPVSQAYKMDGARDTVLRICNQFTPSTRKRHLIYELVGLLQGKRRDTIRISYYAGKKMHHAFGPETKPV